MMAMTSAPAYGVAKLVEDLSPLQDTFCFVKLTLVQR